MAKKNEAELSQDDVWQEHIANVHVGRHWAYMFGVLGGGFLVMVALIALLGSGG